MAIGNAISSAVSSAINTVVKKIKENDPVVQQVKTGVQQISQPKTSYQQNLAVDTPKQPETTRSILGNIAKITLKDPQQGLSLFEQLKLYQSDPSTPVYNPFLQATNPSIQTLANLGFDVSNIDDKWFEDNAYLMNYYETSNTTNNVKAPTKKSSTLSQAAYAYNQLWDARETSNKARQEFNAAMEEAAILAQMTDRNYSDDQIVDMVYGNKKKYPTLAKMEESKLSGEPIELNFAVPYSKDALYGAVWMGRNPDYKGDLNGAMANSYNGVDNVWKEDPEVQEKLENSPYSLGSTMDGMRIYYGQPSFDQQWVDDNRWRLDSKDKTDRDNYIHVAEVVEKTADMKKQADALHGKVDRLLVGATNPEEVMEKVDSLLNSGDYNLLADMDKSIKRGYYTKDLKYMETSEAVNYSRNDVEDYVRKVCAENAAKPNGPELINESAALRTGGQNGTAGAPVYTQEQDETVKAEDEKIHTATGAVDSQLTDDERTVLARTSVASNDTYKFFKDVKAISDTITGMVKASAKKTQEKYFGSLMTVMEPVYQYEKTQKDLNTDKAEFAKLEKKYGDVKYYDTTGVQQEKEIEVKDPVTGMPLTVLLAYREYPHEQNGRYGEYELVGISDPNLNVWLNPAYSGYTEEGFDMGENFFDPGLTGHDREQIMAAVEQQIRKEDEDAFFTEQARRLYENGNDETKKEIEDYRGLNASIQEDEKYIADHQSEYTEDRKTLDNMEREYNTSMFMLQGLGVDTFEMEQVSAVIEYLSQFSDPRPNEIQADTTLETLRKTAKDFGKPLSDEQASKTLHESIAETKAKLEKAQYAMSVVEKSGFQLPENYRTRMKQEIGDLERKIQGLTYDTILTDTPKEEFNEMVALGREWEKEQGFAEIGTFKYSDQFETMRSKADYLLYAPYFTKEEEDLYYYLLGKSVKENTGNISDEAVLASVLKDGSDYYDYMTDGSWGIMTRRHYEGITQEARDYVNSGFWGGALQNLGATMNTALEPIDNAAYAIDLAIKGDKAEYNKYHPLRDISHVKQATREETRKAIEAKYGDSFLGDIAKIGYEIYCNRGDSLVTQLAWGWMNHFSGPIMGEIAGAGMMGFDAGFDAYEQAITSGATHEQALALAGITFVCETVSEGVTAHNIHNMFKADGGIDAAVLKDYLKDWLKIEGRDEAIGEVANSVAENWANRAILGDNGDHARRVSEILREHPTMSPEAAEKAANDEEFGDYLHTALVSYLSAGMGIPGKIVTNSVKTLNHYREVTRKQQQQEGSSDSILTVMKKDRARAKAVREFGDAVTSQLEQRKQRLAAEMERERDLAPFKLNPEGTEESAPENEAAEKNEASAEEAGTAVPENKPTESQQKAAADVAKIKRSTQGNDAAKTAGIAAALTVENANGMQEDQAKAAAAHLDEVFGKDAPLMISEMIIAAEKAGVSGNDLKLAIQYAALGNGACADVVIGDTFQNVDAEGRVFMLMEALQQDTQDQGVQAYMANNVLSFRKTTAMAGMMAGGQFDKAEQAQKKANEARREAREAEERLDEKRDEAEAAAQNADDATEEVMKNPTPETVKQQNDALSKANSAQISVQQGEQEVANAQQKQKNAEQEADKVAKDTLNESRVASDQAVTAENEQRAAEAAQQAADEANRKAQEAENRRQQLIADQRSGKTEEDSARAKLERLAAERGYTGEQAEKFIQDVMEFASNRKFRGIDMSKQLSEAEGYLMMGALSRRFGVNVEIGPTEGGENGYYDPNTNTIRLNSNLPAGQVLVEFALHELTHSLEKTGAYGKYQQAVLDILYPSEAELNNAVAKMMADRESAGHSIDEEQAKKELVAEFTRLRLNDKAVVQRMVDAGLGGQMRNALHNINQFLKNKLTKQTQIDQSGNEGKSIGKKQLTAEDLRRTERLFQKAIQQRSREQQKARKEAIKQANTPVAKLERSATPVVTNSHGDAEVSAVRGGTISRTDGDTEYSVASWTDEEKERVRDQLKDRMISENDGSMTEAEMDAKIDKWIEDVNSVASIILADKHRLDYDVTDPNKRFLKDNQDYIYTLDASTLCAKRLLFQGTFDTIQRMLPNTPLLPEDLIDLANMMREMGYETPCGICYVESRRRWLGKYANEWLSKYDGEYIPTIQQLTTSDGLEELRKSHPEAYESFTAAMRAKGSANPKVVQLRTDYRGDIDTMTPGEVQKVIDIGGLRIQSFSDFEVPHLIDMMQAVLDMSSHGLTSQAYTKVPAFAAVFGDTGIKINLSEIGKDTGIIIDNGLTFDDIASMPYEEAKGLIHLLYDDIEGMKHSDAIALRNQYSKNVGTILFGMNDAHIIAAMADGEVDFIIPFHKSGWSQDELNKMPVLNSYNDYTSTQNERVILGKKEKKETGKGQKAVENWIAKNGDKYKDYKVTEEGNGKYTITYTDGYETESFQKHQERTGEKLSNYEPVGANQYWDFSKSGRENAEAYLEMCKKEGRMPKFSQFLVDNGDGSFSLPQGDDFRSTAIREGYWKTLIDFKMYDNDGNGAEQTAVMPNINMEEARKVLDNYSLSREMPNGQTVTREDNNTLPVAQEVVDAYVQKYIDEHPGREYSDGATEMSKAQMAEVLRSAGLDTSVNERIERQTEQQENAVNALSEWTEGGKTVDQVYELLGDSLYPKMKQWIHNTYEKNHSDNETVLISKDDIIKFLEKDMDDIQKDAESLINGWAKLLDEENDFEPVNLDREDAKWKLDENKGKALTNKQDVASVLFTGHIPSKDGGYDFDNDDTHSKIRISKDTIGKSFNWASSHNVDSKVMGMALMEADELLKNAKYVGSHPDYAHPSSDANIHYLVYPLTIDNDNRLAVFAVHDSLPENKNFSERAYVMELTLINEKEGVQENRSAQENPVAAPDLPQEAPSTVSIADILRTVNTDRLRFFNKDALSNRSFSTGQSELSEAEMNQALVDSGIISQEDLEAYKQRNTQRPLEGQNPFMSTSGGPAQRAFGAGMLQDSDEIAREAKAFILAQNGRTIDTNEEQVERAVRWIRSNKATQNSDGMYESLQKITDGNFDYRSADGQARMIAVMGMAVAKNDIMAQVALADAFNRQGTDLGRALQARKIFRLMTPEGRIASLQKMLQNTQNELNAKGTNVNLNFSEWIYRAAAAANDENDFSKVYHAASQELASQIPANWKEKLQAWRMLSMLGNPRTHIRNVVGNAVFMPAVGLKNKIGAGLEKAFLKEGDRTKTLGLASQEARAFARDDSEAMEGVLKGESKYNEGNAVQQERKIFGQGNGLLSRTVGRLVQGASDLSSNALEAEDWLFLKRHYQNALAGYMTANNLTAADMTGKTLEDARAYAVSEAQKATYRDANSVATWLNNIKNPAARFFVNAVLPFKKTPANILRRGVEYSPVGILRSFSTDARRLKQYLDYQNGKLNALPEKALSPAQYIDRLASGLSGTAITALGMLLSSLGAASAGFDDDDEFERLRENQEYAINPGKVLNSLFHTDLFGEDVSYTMDWASPMSMPFFVGVTLMDEIKKQAANDGKGVNIGSVLDSILGITEPVFNLSMLDGVNSLFNVSQYAEGNAITQVGEKILTNYATSFVPTFVGQVARTMDTTRRKSYVESGTDMSTFRYALESLENKIPWLSRSNIPYRNVWGEPDTSGVVEAALENFISPGYKTDVKDDPVVNELERLYQATRNPNMIPKAAGKTLSIDGKTVKLDAEQYDQYVVDRGQIARQSIESLMESPVWQVCDDDTRAMMVADAWTYAGQIARNNIDRRGKKDNWVKAIEQNGNFVDTVVERAADSNRSDYIKGYGQTMAEALDYGDSDVFELSLAAMEDAGATDAEIRAPIRDYFKPLYQIAYEDNDERTMGEIEEKLLGLGVGFKEKDLEGWVNVDEAGEADPRWLDMTDTTGQYGRGNINLNNRQVVHNPDGSISTERSFSTNIDGMEVLLPTVIDGRIVSEDEAIQHYFDTGEHLGKFQTVEEAEAYAEQLHNRQDWYYHR